MRALFLRVSYLFCKELASLVANVASESSAACLANSTAKSCHILFFFSVRLENRRWQSSNQQIVSGEFVVVKAARTKMHVSNTRSRCRSTGISGTSRSILPWATAGLLRLAGVLCTRICALGGLSRGAARSLLVDGTVVVVVNIVKQAAKSAHRPDLAHRPEVLRGEARLDDLRAEET